MRFVLLYIAFLSLNASAETYYIDDLVIETSSDASSSSCVSGSRHSILVTGSIGPDSTFAVGKLIDQREPCTDASDEVIFPIEVILESGGGYLEDGYKLGKVFRDRGVTTIIQDNKMCASSCAVAFLGGKKRYVADKGSILFHAPYLKQMQLEGKERITCDLPKEELQTLNDYYSSMTSVEVGDRLFERTMWYCSAENGWTIKGSAAAELYGIATNVWDQGYKKIPTDNVIKESYTTASDYLLKKRDMERASIAFTEHLAKYPESVYAPDASYWLGEIYLLQGQNNLAIDYFLKFLNEYSDHEKAAASQYKLGRIYYQIGNKALAGEMLRLASRDGSAIGDKAKDFLKLKKL
jgi:tol-pal system protein YbgF